MQVPEEKRENTFFQHSDTVASVDNAWSLPMLDDEVRKMQILYLINSYSYKSKVFLKK